MGLAVLLVSASLIVILLAAELFTNAVEWFGHRLGLTEGAVGSVLAAVGTALPETMIPLVAIVAIGTTDADEIGIGAILGAPFLLSTAAFAVTGLGIMAFARRRSSGTEMRLNAQVIRRDLGFFFLVYVVAIGSSFIPWRAARRVTAVLFFVLYGLYLRRTFAAGGDQAAQSDDLSPLRFQALTGRSGASPATPLIVLQLAVALGMIIGGAQLFVTNLESIAHELAVPALALALIIAPLATELPEKFNSIIWVRQGKDTLAMGNISGAMVFQSCIPVSVGVALTDWQLTDTALLSAAIALVSAGIVYLSIRQRGYLSAYVLARAGLLWLAFVAFVVVKIALE